jgi:hypothetical protein
MRLFDELGPNAKLELPLHMRSSLMQTNDIKFLIRYEVCSPGEQEVDKMSKHRFARLTFTMDSLYAFLPKKHVILSTKKANEHIFNIQIVDNIPLGAMYQTPQIDSIELINKKSLWTLKKKDNRGQFFIIIPKSEESQELVSLLSYNENEEMSSIFKDDCKKAFFV